MRISSSILTVLAFSIATPAIAQTTNCSWIGSIWSCSASQSPGEAFSRGMQNGLNMQAAVEAARERRALKKQRKLEAVRQEQCRAKIDAALEVRDFELARALADTCGV